MSTPETSHGKQGDRWARFRRALSPAPPRPHPTDYTLCVVRFVTRADVAFSPERGEARLVRVDRGPDRGWRPLVFWTRAEAEKWLDASCYRVWREYLEVVEITRAQWERLVVTEGLIPSNARMGGKA